MYDKNKWFKQIKINKQVILSLFLLCPIWFWKKRRKKKAMLVLIINRWADLQMLSSSKACNVQKACLEGNLVGDTSDKASLISRKYILTPHFQNLVHFPFQYWHIITGIVQEAYLLRRGWFKEFLFQRLRIPFYGELLCYVVH